MKKITLKENLIYLGFWAMLFVAPLLSLYIRTVSDTQQDFNWNEIFHIWKFFAMFLTIFVIHNFLLAPILIYKKNKTLYLILTTAILVGIYFYEYNHRPPKPHERQEMRMEKHGAPSADRKTTPPQDERAIPKRLHQEKEWNKMPPPPRLFNEREIVVVFIIVLMFGMNLGVKYFFKTDNQMKNLREVERQSLEQQLQYLKYQINPHFFMNTLNNIHALVDINQEKAKTSILQLSRLMRYVLYEATKNTVPLQQDIDFIENYIRLMRIRYSEKVTIETDIDNPMPERHIAPMLLINFIENAFKHGISYKKESFIKLKIYTQDEKLYFYCQNSKRKKAYDEKTEGVGIRNTRQRLDLIYGTEYSLNINNGDDTYTVTLEIPIYRQNQ